MKRKIFTLALAALTLGLLGSCSKINGRIDNLDKRVSDIESSIGSINSSIEDLGTIRQNIQTLMSTVSPANVQKLQEASDALDRRISELKEFLDGEVTSYATIEQHNKTVEDLTTLSTKVTGIDDKLTQHIKDATDNIKKAITELQGKVEELMAMIQTVTIVPAYKDGGVEAVDDTVTIEFIVSPATAAAAIEKEKVSVLVNEVKTKTVSGETAPIVGFSKDATKGTVSIKADLKEFVPAEARKSLTVAVNIASGVSNYTTEFVPVALTYTINDVLPGVFSVSATQKVQFLRGNLWYNSSDNSWHIEDKQYYTENEGYGGTTTIEHVTFWNFYDRDHLVAFYFPSSVQNSNYGTKDLRDIDRYSPNDVLHDNFGLSSDDHPCVDKIEWGEVYGKGHTLSYAEWGYLCSVDATHNMINGINYSNGVRAGRNRDNVTVVGCKGLLLVPDDWDLTENPLVDTYTKEQWAVAEAEGAVFLPNVMVQIFSGIIDCGKVFPTFMFLCGDSYTEEDGDIEFGIYTNQGFEDGESGLYSFYDGTGSSVRLVVYTEE